MEVLWGRIGQELESGTAVVKSMEGRDGPRQDRQGVQRWAQGSWEAEKEPELRHPVPQPLGSSGGRGSKGPLGGHLPGKVQGSGRAKRSSLGAMAGSQSCPRRCHRIGLPLPSRVGEECENGSRAAPGSVPSPTR